MYGHLGTNLKTERVLRGLSQRQLAQLAGLPPSTVRDIEIGKVRSPRPATMAALAQALDVSAEYLLYPRSSNGETITLPVNEIAPLLVEWAQLSPERRALALNLIRTLREEQAP